MLNHALLGVASGGGYQVENSLLFRGAQYLTRTPSVVGNRKTWTLSLWLRRNRLGTEQMLFSAGASGGRFNLRWCLDGSERLFLDDDAGMLALSPIPLWRDPTGFLHLVVAVDTTQEAVAERVTVYCNGLRITDWSAATYPARNTEFSVNNTVPHVIGRNAPTAVFFMEAELAELILVDGAALSPDRFGQTDPVTGSWRPKQVQGVDFGTNGFYLGKPWEADNLGGDASGRGNDWTPVGFAASDAVSDSPTNVFATLNPVAIGSTIGLSGGNLAPTSAGSWGSTLGTLRMTTGKWFWAATNMTTSGNLFRLGIATGTYAGVPANLGTDAGKDANSWIVQGDGTAQIRSQHNAVYLWSGTVPVTLVDADYFVCAFDADTKKLWLGVHDISASTTYWMDSAGTLRTTNEPALGTNQTYTVTGTEWFPVAACAATGMVCDFGQKSFGGVTPPDGFKALCTANLPVTTGQSSGTFTGNANADGPCVFTGAVPETLSVNGNAVIWGTHADRLATGFKIRTASLAYNASGANSWAVTYDKKPTVGPKGRALANAQGN